MSKIIKHSLWTAKLKNCHFDPNAYMKIGLVWH